MNHELKIFIIEQDNEGLLLVEFSDNDVFLPINSIMLTIMLLVISKCAFWHTLTNILLLNWALSIQPDKTAKKMRK